MHESTGSTCGDHNTSENGVALHFTDTVTHLGHILQRKLDDEMDIAQTAAICAGKQTTCSIPLYIYSGCDLRVKTKLIVTHCLSLYNYGCVLWRIEIAFSNILRNVWRLPRHCHTRILHCVAGVQNKITELSSRFVSRACLINIEITTHHISLLVGVKPSIHSSRGLELSKII